MYATYIPLTNDRFWVFWADPQFCY